MTEIRSKEADQQQRARKERLVIKKPPAARDPADLIPCIKHPDWRPSAAEHGPRPPQNSDGSSPLCPRCREEADRRAGREKKPVPKVDVIVVDPYRSSPREDALWEAKQDQLREAGRVFAGDPEEGKALARIDQLREEDNAGRIAGAHPDLGGDWHYLHHASERDIKRRRSRARAYWKKYASAR